MRLSPVATAYHNPPGLLILFVGLWKILFIVMSLSFSHAMR